MLLCTYYGLENFKYFWSISIDAYKVKSSIFLSEKLNNLSKITEQKLVRQYLYSKIILTHYLILFPKLKGNIILNICRGKQGYGIDLF